MNGGKQPIAGLEGEVVQAAEDYFVRLDGVVQWLRWEVRPWYTSDGSVGGIIIFTEDITADKQVEAALRQSEERLQILQEIDKAILLARSPQEIATAALSQMRRLIPCRRASVTLFDFETNDMLILAADINGATTLSTGGRWPLEVQRVAQLKDGQPFLVNDLLTLTKLEPTVQVLKTEGIRSYINIPLVIRAELIGSLNLASNQPNAFRPEHVAIAQEVADQLAIALHNAQLFEQVHRGREQLRNLTGYLQAVREEERTRIARDLHDEFGQALTALKMDVAWLAKQLPKHAAPLHHKTGMMASLIDATIQLTRRVAAELRPGVLDDLGLVAAMEWQAQEFTARTGIPCELRLSENDIILGHDLATSVFRIFQEILTNVARHAQASQVTVELLDQPGELTLIVGDNGRGITPEQLHDPESLGLIGMRERANSWGGTITFRGIAGEGTTITLRIPRVNTTKEDHTHD
ncbi:MAG: histidine kinase [Anaerolineae bacterium]